jgi:D-alanyl-D-alanine carboxypeptidase
MKNQIVCLLLLVSVIFSQTIAPEKLDHYFSYIENNNMGVGSLSVFKNGKEVYVKNLDKKHPRINV